MSITVQDLMNGTRPRLKPREVGQLLGVSQSTLSRWRWEGERLAFERDAYGRIWYRSEVVLCELTNRPKFESTSQYQHAGVLKMEHARAAKTTAGTSMRADSNSK